MSVIREGFVVRDLDGSAKGDGQASWTLARMCRSAGLPVRYWQAHAAALCRLSDYADWEVFCTTSPSVVPERESA